MKPKHTLAGALALAALAGYGLSFVSRFAAGQAERRREEQLELEALQRLEGEGGLVIT